MAWNDVQGGIQFTRSADGGMTWDDPVNVTSPGDEPFSSPWALVDASGRVHVLYYSLTTESSSRLVLATWTPSGTTWWTLASNVTGFEARPSNTDMAHMVAGPDGRLAVVWGDRGSDVASVAFLRPAADAPQA